ncbi:hypothetical protein C491_13402 [Natronococcus amylolyticus DSM 10524]|uniref:HEAT repeat domain-containing protein n=1 Tax=Natronococcus amylolyticus DSM 10524 TaxID=1227497 RepID=L9X7F0_9EURY|nr:HEAT repeat domain-containing protein [Natronococcus amylolyticus]ELY56538.1 hypothetical protein C491_13402 [Natronococcus amylolyticus DSM 10524]
MEAITLVVWATIGLGSVVLLVGTATLVVSVRKQRKAHHVEVVKPVITAELASRLDEDDPSWNDWVEELSPPEWSAVRETGKRLLPQIHGGERTKLQQLVYALGFTPERLRNDLESDNLYLTLRALSWLALLEYPSAVDTALRTCTWNQSVRTATARVLFENDDPRAKRTGVDLLLWEGREPLSIFGLDTLYRIVIRKPEYLLSIANEKHGEWEDAVLIQVLTVLQHCQSGVSPSSLTWILFCLDHESPEVRAAALSTLAEYGWNQQLRDAVEIEDLLTDPSPKVRRIAYDVYGRWNTNLERVVTAVQDEPDDLARLVGVRVLHTQGRQKRPANSPEALERTWRWVEAEHTAVLEDA